MKTMNQKTEGRYLTFSAAQKEYAVEVQKVREILEPSLMEPLPNPSSHVRWAIRIRGRVVPVIDLRRYLGLEKAGARPTQSVLTVVVRGWNGPQLLGLLVDGIREVIQVWSKDLEVERVEAGGAEGPLWPIQCQDREVVLLDADLLSAKEAASELNFNLGGSL